MGNFRTGNGSFTHCRSILDEKISICSRSALPVRSTFTKSGPGNFFAECKSVRGYPCPIRLRQKSSPKNSTPDDYKLPQPENRGSAAGKNETILYYELSSGLLVRSTEDAQQTMDVLVALTDGSNSVRYTLDAKSHSDMLLLVIRRNPCIEFVRAIFDCRTCFQANQTYHCAIMKFAHALLERQDDPS